MKKKEGKKTYSWVPEDYLKGVFIEPHNFIFPENPEHGKYVHNQLRYDLFYNAYNKIADVEARYLEQPDDYFRLKKIEPTQPSLINQILTYFNKDQRLGCELWTMDLNGKKESYYTVHTYQSETDRFYTEVVPRDFMRFLYMWWDNSNFF